MQVAHVVVEVHCRPTSEGVSVSNKGRQILLREHAAAQKYTESDTKSWAREKT